MSKNADAKIALVTGGNRGIGLEICRQLAEKGLTVILTSRDLSKGERTAASLQGRVVVRQLDVTDDAQTLELAGAMKAEFGVLDVLVNNAGISIGSKGIPDADLSTIREIMETNFFGPIRVTKAFLPLLRRSRDARVINISSGMGALSDLNGGYAGYRLSKAGLNAQTILLANDLRGSGIKVNAVCPGWVRTDMGGRSAPRTLAQGADTAVWLATAVDIPTGKFLRDRKEISW